VNLSTTRIEKLNPITTATHFLLKTSRATAKTTKSAAAFANSLKTLPHRGRSHRHTAAAMPVARAIRQNARPVARRPELEELFSGVAKRSAA